MSLGRVMVIGAAGVGKSSLIKALAQETGGVSKTQSIQYHSQAIDTPGEYVENPYYYRALFATSLEAKLLLFVQDATRDNSQFPPGFSQGFPRPAIGVMTKIDHPRANLEQGKRLLKEAGVINEILAVSAVTGEGIAELRQLLEVT
ncbi:MAG: EutP/PduV family microcompartment system protein [Bacillota bacterium]|nr:EutP/PduV family microcompartment system protein [Bacillota bacterium]